MSTSLNRWNALPTVLLICCVALGFTGGCVTGNIDMPVRSQTAVPNVEKKSVDYSSIRNHSYRSRDTIPVDQNLYEGSLWRDESSWGNLLRDHRARFKNDVLTIIELPAIVTLPDEAEKKPLQRPLMTAGEETAETANLVLDALSGEELAKREQREVLRNLRSVSARVTSVLPNGNMLVVGEKVDYKQFNSVRYVTRVKGIIRPEDVNQKNEVLAIKLANSEVKTKRQVLMKSLNALAPVLGTQKTGLLDRLSHLATPSQKSTATTTTVSKQ